MSSRTRVLPQWLARRLAQSHVCQTTRGGPGSSFKWAHGSQPLSLAVLIEWLTICAYEWELRLAKIALDDGHLSGAVARTDAKSRSVRELVDTGRRNCRNQRTSWPSFLLATKSVVAIGSIVEEPSLERVRPKRPFASRSHSLCHLCETTSFSAR